MSRMTVFRHEGYGAGNKFGHKLWINAEANSSDMGFAQQCQALAAPIAEKYKNEPVCIKDHQFTADEVTIFFYGNRQPATETDNWIADHVATVSIVHNEPALFIH